MTEQDSKKITVTFTNKTVVRVVVFVVLAFVVISFFERISFALQLIFISAFLALALNPAVSWIAKKLKSKSRVRATAAAYTIVMSLLIGFSILVIPPFVRQMVNLVDQIPLSVQDIHNQDTAIVHFIEKHNLTEEYTQIISDVQGNLKGASGRAYSTATTVGSGIVAIITILVMTFMMLVEGPEWIRRYIALQPKNKVDKHVDLLEKMYKLVTGYVNGQLLIAIIAAVFAFFALLIASTLLNVSVNAVALASIVGLIGLIPLIGNTIAAVIVVLFCLFVSLPLAIIMGVFFLVYQQVENSTLQPYIQSKYNELTPLTVFVAAIIGVSVAGFLGALVAIPIAGCLKLYIKTYYGHKLVPKNNEKPAV